MTNHPNRSQASVTDKAVGLLIRDPRSGYAKTDSQGKRNIRFRYCKAIAEGLGQDDEITMTAQQVAQWYAQTFWR